ncbi:MAG TPA: sulfite exporter TauE/SafE family protein [Thermoplasmatales archaeon]|nr:sulfite exporter TauE/SafE family protein [Thermoplasmatales archaeon]
MSEILIILAAFFASVIDTSLGMCYGTILTPSLIIAGYSPTIVVPAVLLSQLVVDTAGGAAHTKVKNFTKRDIKVALLVAIPATTLAGIGAFSNLNLSKIIIKSYIGVLVAILGFLTLYGIRLRKSPKGLVLISSIAGFNKGFMGGGFGPVVVSGQIIFNHDVRPSVAIGDIAEIPVCIVGLLVFAIFAELSFSTIFLIVCIPAIVGSLIGPHLTVRISQKNYAEKIIGVAMLMLGVITLMKIFLG